MVPPEDFAGIDSKDGMVRVMGAAATVFAYHALVIHPQLNGFQGYDAVVLEVVSPEEAVRLKREFGI